MIHVYIIDSNNGCHSSQPHELRLLGDNLPYYLLMSCASSNILTIQTKLPLLNPLIPIDHHLPDIYLVCASQESLHYLKEPRSMADLSHLTCVLLCTANIQMLFTCLSQLRYGISPRGNVLLT